VTDARVDPYVRFSDTPHAQTEFVCLDEHVSRAGMSFARLRQRVRVQQGKPNSTLAGVCAADAQVLQGCKRDQWKT
jgi:hypothetical protein